MRHVVAASSVACAIRMILMRNGYVSSGRRYRNLLSTVK